MIILNKGDTMIIGKTFKFDAAHHLPMYDGPCKNLHGHTYTLTVEVEGIINGNDMMLMDLAELSRITHLIIDKLDHQDLNRHFTHTTCESMTMKIGQLISLNLPNGVFLHSITLQEGTGGYARWQKGKI